MTEFMNKTQLIEPKDLMKERFISTDGQLSVEEAKKIAKEHGIVWGD